MDTSLTKFPKRPADSKKTQAEWESYMLLNPAVMEAMNNKEARDAEGAAAIEARATREAQKPGFIDSVKASAGAVKDALVQPVAKKISDWASTPAVQTQLGEWKANLSTMIPSSRGPSDIMPTNFDNLPVQAMKAGTPVSNARPSWADQPNLPKIRQDALKAWEADNSVDTTQWMKDNSAKYQAAPMTPEERERKRKAYEAMSRGTAEL